MSNRRHRSLAAVRYAWAAPASLVGLLLGLACVARGATVRKVDGVIEIAGGRTHRIVAMLPRRLRFGAITLGHVVIGLDHDLLRDVRGHERIHVRQYERWGALFFPLYVGSSVLQLLRGKDPYLNNCFEREAFAGDGSRSE
jgi:hypothetical protein